ncbi:MAG: helix-turn-helix transcriptional regulator [Candidatus Portnoybacteria bacterium]|nr:helix-turn-helix transcriptional regulator [Candidatus Portnoybacteria bacterium]
MKNYRDFKKELLRDKEIKRVYQELEPEFAIVRMLVNHRIERGLTQKDLALRIGTKQSAIARLESGRYNPTLGFLQKIAHGLNAKIKLSIVK